MAISEAGGQTKNSGHVSDPVLQPFLQQKFDPAEYLNSTLPPLAINPQSTPARASSATKAASLAEISSETQSLLSQLNAQASRLSTVLTQLTDDIIRSGSRLAYEVDVLRGEALGLSEVVNDGLKEEIKLFTDLSTQSKAAEADVDEQKEAAPPSEPQYLTQLRMLTKVRQRLDGVIQIFGAAMQWTLPPSEVSIASSFISVSSPENGADSQSREQKGKEFAEKLRTEITDVILNTEDPKTGLSVAQARLDALRDLAQVWKGTAEEKARIRFVENLTKLAEERLRELERGDRFASRTTSPRKTAVTKSAGSGEDKGVSFLESLGKLKETQ